MAKDPRELEGFEDGWYELPAYLHLRFLVIRNRLVGFVNLDLVAPPQERVDAAMVADTSKIFCKNSPAYGGGFFYVKTAGTINQAVFEDALEKAPKLLVRKITHDLEGNRLEKESNGLGTALLCLGAAGLLGLVAKKKSRAKRKVVQHVANNH